VALLDRIRAVAADVLAPAAPAVDAADRIPAGHLAALAEAGAFAIRRDLLPPAEFGAISEALAGACGATAFVWQQHGGPLGLAANGPAALRARWADTLASGRALGGVCFAHLRRAGPAVLRAEPDGPGWRFVGEAPWATSWGTAAVFAVAAATADDRIVWAFVDGHEQPGLTASAPLALSVFRATSTVRLSFEHFRVAPDAVAAVQPGAAWRRADLVAGNRCNPAVLGVAAAAVERLTGEPPPAAATAAALRDRLDAVRCRWVALATDPTPDLDDLASHRSAALTLAGEATNALLAAVAGGGMLLDHPAQRLAREAAFYTVQAQTPLGRTRRLADLARGRAGRPRRPALSWSRTVRRVDGRG
jgi:hypothetical protein